MKGLLIVQADDRNALSDDIQSRILALAAASGYRTSVVEVGRDQVPPCVGCLDCITKHPGSCIYDYKRYLWSQWYVEYQAMPLFAAYSDSSGGTSGFELWNELHFGCMINFSIGKASFFINPQAILGLCLYKSNEPPAFRTAEHTNPAFYFPDFYVLPNILVGIRF
jgi:hypothetical protein